MATRMQQRRGTATMWTNANPILGVAEIGYETDTNKFKIGDGTNRWADLSYFVDLDTMIAGAPGLLNSLDEIAAAIGDDPAFFTTLATSLSDKAPLNSPTFTGTVSGVTKSMVGLGSVDNTTDAGKPVSTAQATAIATAKSEAITAAGTAADTKVSDAVTALTKSSVGLGNVDNTSDANKPVSTATQTALDAKASNTALSNHEADTTSIHGITDTAELATKAFAASLLTGASKTNITISGEKNGLTITAENGVADSTTDDLAQGTTNKYFSNALAVTAVQNAINTQSFEAMIDGGGV